MTDSSLHQARAEVDAGRVWHAIEILRRIVVRNPENADALALSSALLTDVFAKGGKAYKDGRLGLAAWCFSLLAELGEPREPLSASRDAVVSLLLRRATDDANAGRAGDAKQACRLVLALDPAAPQALLLAGQLERGVDGDAEIAAKSIDRGLQLAHAMEQADYLRDTALQAGIRAIADQLVQGRPAGPLLGTLDRLCPPGQAEALARCRTIVSQAESWQKAARENLLRQAASAALHWLGELRQERHRYREAFETHKQAFDLWGSPAGLEHMARAHQYLAIEELLEALKGFGWAYVYDMEGHAAARTAFESLSATMERLLEMPGIDNWTRTQRWATLLGLRAVVGYASALGSSPLSLSTDNPFAETVAPVVPAQPATRRIFDCCTFFNEAEILEIRMAELYDVVERFVVVEAAQTYSGEPKTLTFGDHHERFRPYMDKIRYVVVDELAGTFSWQREACQRDAILRGLEDCRDDDMIIVSDVDEILRHEVVERLRDGGPAFDAIFVAELDLFFYRLNYRFARDWRAAGAAPFSIVRQLGPNIVRYLAKQNIGHVIPDAGWHFSWIGDLDRFSAKLSAYSHREHAQSFGERKMAGVASFLGGGSTIPEGAPGAGEEYEVLPVDRHPRLVRDNLDRYRTMGWIR